MKTKYQTFGKITKSQKRGKSDTPYTLSWLCTDGLSWLCRDGGVKLVLCAKITKGV